MFRTRHASTGALLAALAFVPAQGSATPSETLARDLEGATLLARTSDAAPVALVLVPTLVRSAEAADYARRVSTPGDALYKHFLTPDEFADRFGMSSTDYAGLVAWAGANGLAISEASKGRTLLSVTGAAATIERLFSVRIDDYRGPDGEPFHAPDRALTLPAELAGRISSVVGLSTRHRRATLVHSARRVAEGSPHPLTAGGTGVGGGFGPSDLRTAYQVYPQEPAVAPTETVAVFEQGGFVRGDVEKYLNRYKLPRVEVKARQVNHAGTAVTDPGVELEAVLDIDMVAGVNPSVRQILVYEDGVDAFGVALLDALTAMANDHVASTISISYGLDEVLQGDTQLAAENVLFTQLASQGQAVFVSAGDYGAYGDTGNGLHVLDPGAQPFVTSVGGTALRTGPAQQYLGETVWDDLGFSEGATGGGVSAYWILPPYQLAAGSTSTSVAAANGGSSSMRNVPDVSSVADPTTGVSVFSELNGGWLVIGGTSASSPIAAAEYSLVNQANNTIGLGSVGFLNPLLYSLQQVQGHQFTHDVQDGSNGNVNLYGIPGFTAGPGYDNTTGWGSPVENEMLIESIAGGPNSDPPSAVGGVRLANTSNSVTLHWNKVPGALGYLLAGANLANYQYAPAQTTTGTTATVNGLIPSTKYVFEVISVSRGGFNLGSEYYFQTGQ